MRLTRNQNAALHRLVTSATGRAKILHQTALALEYRGYTLRCPDGISVITPAGIEAYKSLDRPKPETYCGNTLDDAHPGV